MGDLAKMRNVVEMIVNGKFLENLCRVCMKTLESDFEDVFTEHCSKGQYYSISKVLETLCGLKIEDNECCYVCLDCFNRASTAYMFYMTCKHSDNMLNFYLENLESNLSLIDSSLEGDSICISLPLFGSIDCIKTEVGSQAIGQSESDNEMTHSEDIIMSDNETDQNTVSSVKIEPLMKDENSQQDDDNVVFFNDNGEPIYYKVEKDCLVEVDTKKYTAVKINDSEDEMDEEVGGSSVNEDTDSKKSENATEQQKKRKARSPMSFKSCSQCPVQYRFPSKLKEHMKADHGIDLYICKLCKFTTEEENEYHSHLKVHQNIYSCYKCGVCFKKLSTMNSHLKKHEEDETMITKEGAHICELCGQVLPSDLLLKEHYDQKHYKKFTCYYCGKSYKGEVSFESHVKKHESEMDQKNEKQKKESQHKKKTKENQKKDKQFKCDICNRNFVDGRALLWHQRLHNDVKPYACKVCGRGFVSAPRRNAHVVCAHSPPARRCPLCPALFHFASMVNSHIWKVHLTAHKRRCKSTKYKEVFWRTEPVPLQDLSVSVQSRLLELSTDTDNQHNKDRAGTQHQHLHITT